MIKETPALQTSDGRLFTDKAEAEAHDYALRRALVIEWFISQKREEYTDRGTVTATRIIGDFLDAVHASDIEIPAIPNNETEEES